MGKRKQVAWNAENDRKLLLHCMRSSIKDLPLEQMSRMFPGATIKALEERIAKLRRKAKDELAEMDLLPSNKPVSPSGPSIPTGHPGPSHPSTSTEVPWNFHYSSGQLLPQDFESSVSNFPNRTSELSPRKRRANKSALDVSATETAIGSTSGRRKRGRPNLTEQRAAEKARMFGGAIDDEDEAFSKGRLKRAKREETEDEDDLKEIDKVEMAVIERHRRPYGMGYDTKAEKEIGVGTLPQKMDAVEVVVEVKEEEKKVNTPDGDLEIVDLDAIKEESVVETKLEI